ncbi:hypothetical protein [Pedobacter sp. R-06]|uniref:hypothetical protein n=1 Tax=Pedobacter sp. R-06 TaxID=3404051 RepID=UPI003CE82795
MIWKQAFSRISGTAVPLSAIVLMNPDVKSGGAAAATGFRNEDLCNKQQFAY